MAMMLLKPPMGWNAWNYFGYADISETVVKETADAMIEHGFLTAGYNYVNIDDCWMSRDRDSNGNICPDPVKFPGGMKAIGNYIHERGMKLGLYAGAGVLTYAGRAGTFGFERRDAKKFAEWGVDLLKYDFGFVPPGANPPHLFRRMGQALRESGRDIAFSGCLGRKEVTEWMKSTGANMWRLSGDITDNWESILKVALNAVGLEPFSGHSGWNDPDMMVIGLNGEGYVGKIGGGCTLNEYEAHFAIWCMLSAPLLMGHDVRKSTDDIKQFMLNEELIAINQDDLGLSAVKLPPMSFGDIILSKPLYGGDIAFLMVNDWDTPKKMVLSWDYCGWDMNDKVKLRDVIERQDIGTYENGFAINVQPHCAKVYRASRI